MIYGVGTDIVAVARLERLLERYGERAARRILAPAEHPAFERSAHPARHLAKRFAAKEALGKALGLGVREPATLHAMVVAADALGKPSFECRAPLAAWMSERRLRAHLSLSDEAHFALAFVVVEQDLRR